MFQDELNSHFTKLLVALLILMTVSACEVSTRVTISNPAIPPTFKLSGNGNLFHFIVVGPYSSLQDLESDFAKAGAIWQLSPDEHATTRVDDLPGITYGQVPNGFKQDLPLNRSPRALEPGKFYRIGSPSLSANFRVFCFKVEPAAIVEITCK